MKTILLGAVILLAVTVYLTRNSASDNIVLNENGLALLDEGDNAIKSSAKSTDNSITISNNDASSQEKRGTSRVGSGTSSHLFLTSTNSDIYYYVPETGDIVSMNTLGKISTKIIGTIPPLALKISWANDGKELFATYYNGIHYYSLKDGSTRKIDDKIFSPTFSKEQNKISYIYFNDKTGEGNISISDAKMSGYKNIFPTRYSEWDTKWISSKYLAITSKPNENTLFSTLAILNTEESSLSTLINSKKDLDSSWSNDGTKFVYSYLNTRTNKYELRYYDVINGEDSRLGISTLASKCAWKSDNRAIFCGVPESPIVNEGTKKRTNDSFHRIDIMPEVVIKQLTTVTDMDVAEIVYSAQSDSVFFVNEKNGSMYSLPVN